MRRIVLMLTVATLLVVALTITAGTGLAKQATVFSKGELTTHKGNSTNSQVDSCAHGKSGNGSAC
jgi:hypothetical protein